MMGKEISILNAKFLISDDILKYASLKNKFDTAADFHKDKCIHNLSLAIKMTKNSANIEPIMNAYNEMMDEHTIMIKETAIPLLCEYNIFHYDAEMYDKKTDCSEWYGILMKMGSYVITNNAVDIQDFINDISYRIFNKIDDYFNAIFIAFLKILQEEEADIDFRISSEKDISKARAIENNIYNIPYESRGRALLEALRLSPFELSLYVEPFWYFDKETSLEIFLIAKELYMDTAVFKNMIAYGTNHFMTQIKKDDTFEKQDKTWNYITDIFTNLCYGYGTEVEEYLEPINKEYYSYKASLMMNFMASFKDDAGMMSTLKRMILSIDHKNIKEELLKEFYNYSKEIGPEIFRKKLNDISKDDKKSLENLLNECKLSEFVKEDDNIHSDIVYAIENVENFIRDKVIDKIKKKFKTTLRTDKAGFKRLLDECKATQYITMKDDIYCDIELALKRAEKNEEIEKITRKYKKTPRDNKFALEKLLEECKLSQYITDEDKIYSDIVYAIENVANYIHEKEIDLVTRKYKKTPCDNKAALEKLLEECKSSRYITDKDKIYSDIVYAIENVANYIHEKEIVKITRKYEKIPRDNKNELVKLFEECKASQYITDKDKIYRDIVYAIENVEKYKEEIIKEKEQKRLISEVENKMKKVDFDNADDVENFKTYINELSIGRVDSILAPYILKVDNALDIIADNKIIESLYQNTDMNDYKSMEKCIAEIKKYPNNRVGKKYINDITYRKEKIRRIKALKDEANMYISKTDFDNIFSLNKLKDTLLELFKGEEDSESFQECMSKVENARKIIIDANNIKSKYSIVKKDDIEALEKFITIAKTFIPNKVALEYIEKANADIKKCNDRKNKKNTDITKDTSNQNNNRINSLNKEILHQNNLVKYAKDYLDYAEKEAQKSSPKYFSYYTLDKDNKKNLERIKKYIIKSLGNDVYPINNKDVLLFWSNGSGETDRGIVVTYYGVFIANSKGATVVPFKYMPKAPRFSSGFFSNSLYLTIQGSNKEYEYGMPSDDTLGKLMANVMIALWQDRNVLPCPY